MASYEKRGNSYRIKASCGYNAQGKQVFQRITWTPPEGMTEKQIEKELNRQCVLFDEECKKGFVVSPIKFETFAEQWFEEYANHNLRSTTLTRSRQLTKRTYEAIGHIRLDKLNARVIQRFINSLTAEGTNQNTGKGLAKKTIVHYLSFISTVLDYAIKMDMLSTNPCRKVTIPNTVIHYDAVTHKESVKTYHSDSVKYHISFSASKYPDRLRKLVNNGQIIVYLDDLEQKVADAIERQVQLWKESDKEYLLAVENGDIHTATQLENCLLFMAREAVFDCMVYI